MSQSLSFNQEVIILQRLPLVQGSGLCIPCPSQNLRPSLRIPLPRTAPGQRSCVKVLGGAGETLGIDYRLVQFFFFCLSHLFYRKQVFIWWEIWGLEVYLRKFYVKVTEFNKEKSVGFVAELTTSFQNTVISYYLLSKKISALFYFILTKVLCDK